MYSGVIEGVGPRYCPSIEDKIHRFADKQSHQIFLEPEGLTTNEFYPNGISTSLPFDVQIRIVRSMKGLERAHILRPGYAIEYDYFDPARAQGVAGDQGDRLACISPARSTARRGTKKRPRRACWPDSTPPAPPRAGTRGHRGATRRISGVLVDDLITRGVSEPYRMFTSRAEYRLSLREDNADARLTEAGRELGCVDDRRWDAYCRKRDAVAREIERLRTTYVNPRLLADGEAERVAGKALEREYSLTDLLRRPDVDYANLVTLRAREGQLVADRRRRRPWIRPSLNRSRSGSSTPATSRARTTRSRASPRPRRRAYLPSSTIPPYVACRSRFVRNWRRNVRRRSARRAVFPA